MASHPFSWAKCSMKQLQEPFELVELKTNTHTHTQLVSSETRNMNTSKELAYRHTHAQFKRKHHLMRDSPLFNICHELWAEAVWVHTLGLPHLFLLFFSDTAVNKVNLIQIMFHLAQTKGGRVININNKVLINNQSPVLPRLLQILLVRRFSRIC